MIALRRALLVLILGLAVGGCGDGQDDTAAERPAAETSSPERDARADRARAQASVLRLDDFPSGWRGESSQEGADDENECLDLSEEYDIAAEAESDTFVNGDTTQALSGAAVFRSEDDARSAFEALTDPEVARCMADLIEREADDDAVVTDTSFGALRTVGSGDESEGQQLVVTVESDGVEVDVFLDWISVRSGPVVSVLMFQDVLSPFDVGLEEELVTTVASRMSGGETDDPATRATSADSQDADAALGEAVRFPGEWTVVVEGVDVVDQLPGDAYSRPVETAGQFLILTLKVRNDTGRSATFDDSLVDLVDEDGTEYTASAGKGADQIGALPNYLDERELQPKTFERGTLAFDVPAAANVATAKVYDELDSFGLEDAGYRIVDLEL